jgi:hypothetical protein
MHEYGIKLEVGNTEDEVVDRIFEFKQKLRNKEREIEEAQYRKILRMRNPIVVDDDAENISTLFPDTVQPETIQPVEFRKDKHMNLNNVSELDMDLLEEAADAAVSEIPIENRVEMNDQELRDMKRQEMNRVAGEFSEENINDDSFVKRSEKGIFVVDEDTIVDRIAFDSRVPEPLGDGIIEQTIHKSEHDLYDLYEFTPTSYEQIQEMIT